MKIEHVAIWTSDLERLRGFYEKYFQAAAGSRYANERKHFISYFLTFPSGARLELMCWPQVSEATAPTDSPRGYAHIAFATGAAEQVDALAERLRQDGYTIVDSPRWTGDGYYESVVLDPDGNRLEITI